MGITGLLPIVKSIIARKHIGKYENSRVGIDGHAWIHQVIPAIASDIYYKNPTNKHTIIFMNKVKTLLDYHIKPVFIFDGDFLQSKEKTFLERRRQREKSMMEVKFWLERNEISKARELMKRCVSVTPEILHSVLQILRANGIEYIISPYEADAQLHYLQKIKYIDYIITEDSDLIVYGASKILYKFSGTYADEYDSSKLHLCKGKYFQENILDICILSGCDYLDSIKGVGLVTAHKRLEDTKSIKGFINFMESLNKEVPKDYLEEFNKAKSTFLHHIVYDPITKQRLFLTRPSCEYEFLGTLENLPFKVSSLFIDRHYIPKPRIEFTSVATPEEFSTETVEDCILDSNLALPYFD